MAHIYEKSKRALALLDRHIPVIVFDTETTGLSKEKDYIIEFSAMLYEWNIQKRVWDRTDTFERFIKPPICLPQKIVDITGITDQKLADKPSEMEVFPEILNFMCRGKIFVGQNVNFDIGMLNGMVKRCSTQFKDFNPGCVIDTLAIAKELIDKNDLKDHSYKLENLAEYYGVSTKGYHDSTIDIINTWAVLLKEMDDYEIQLLDEDDNHGITDFSIISMNRWKKSYGKDHRLDRLYIRTTKGDVVYDFIKNSVYPKNGKYPNVDVGRLISEMNRIAKRCGYDDYTQFA